MGVVEGGREGAEDGKRLRERTRYDDGPRRELPADLERLIRDGADPFSFLVITFTNAAATEMKEKIRKRLSEERSDGRIAAAAENATRIRDGKSVMESIGQYENVSAVQLEKSDLAKGSMLLQIALPRSLYYQTISEQTGLEVRNDGDLIATLSEMSLIKRDYDSLRNALEDVRTKGYGVVMPDSSQMQLEEPQIIRQGGKYSVKLKASAPAIHMLMTRIETEVTPAIGGETASEDIINFLLQGFDGDVNRIWQSNIFGKSLNELAEEGLTAKLEALPEDTKQRLQETLQRIINEGGGGLICILL